MIVYNMRYRGPYEYDKFILNVFQFHNEMIDLEKAVNSDNASLASNENLLNKLEKSAENICDQLVMIREWKSEV